MPSKLSSVASISFALVMAEFSLSVLASNGPCSFPQLNTSAPCWASRWRRGNRSLPKVAWDESGKKTDTRVFVNILTAQAFASGKTPVPGTEKPEVRGVGDEAYYKYYAPPKYDKVKVVDLDVKKGNRRKATM